MAARPPDPLDPPRFALSRALFLRLLGVVYGIAFVSLLPQLPGLVGSEGLLPAAGYLERFREFYGWEAYVRLPTLLWLWPGDGLLIGIAWLGVVLSAAAMAGLAPGVTFAGLWVCYLSLMVAGQDFLSFQWDALLLEAGLLAVLYAPAGRRLRFTDGREPHAGARWLVWGLAWKLTFLSGVTKLLSGDATWWGLTALRHHYETQPLPTWVGWYAHQAPTSVATLSTGVMFAIELAAPFVAFVPPRFRRVRAAGCLLLCGLQAAIAATGNYGFFNLLTVVLYVALLDDATLARLVPGWRAGVAPPPQPRALRAGLAALLAVLSAYTVVRELRRPAPMPEPAAALFAWVAPFQSVNGYGLFRAMTVERPEIVIEGSVDGVAWREIPFRWKAGDPHRAPGFVQPHMPRLDWQLWFAALGPPEAAHWLRPLAARVLDGAPAVLALLDDDHPFADAPPQFVRLVLYDYRFTTWDEGADGAWWRRERMADLTGPLSREDLP